MATASALADLQASLAWWRESACAGRPSTRANTAPTVDATLCRPHATHSHSKTVPKLTNMMLLKSAAGRLSATILLDPSDPSGPMRHWPGHTIAALQQLAEVQQQTCASPMRAARTRRH